MIRSTPRDHLHLVAELLNADAQVLQYAQPDRWAHQAAFDLDIKQEAEPITDIKPAKCQPG